MPSAVLGCQKHPEGLPADIIRKKEPAGVRMSAKRMTQVWLGVLLGCSAVVAVHAGYVERPQYKQEAALDLQREFGTVEGWKAVVTAAIPPSGEIEADEGPSLSKICFIRAASGTGTCAYFRDIFDSRLTFQVLSGLSVERLTEGTTATKGLVLKADALYPTGQLHEIAIWSYATKRDDFHLALAVGFNEERILNSGALAGTLMTSDWRRERGETRWSDHRREIQVYRYITRNDVGVYRKILDYTTTKKYGAEDMNTIEQEFSVIESKLAREHH
jgi:hypothetical protein